MYMKICIIEDDSKLNQALKISLESIGFKVDGFTNGREGEQHFVTNNKNYDLLILDLELPDRHGSEICKNVRTWKVSTPILILTGRDQMRDKVSLLNAGADDYLTKPFSIPELVARARALLRRPTHALPIEMHFRDLVLNSTTHQVIKNGEGLSLTMKEFLILEYLMRHPEQVVTRDQILDHVWDFNFSSFSNIVDVYITNLRKKLDLGEAYSYLETIRGVGYRLKQRM